MALDNAQFPSELSIVDPPGTDPLSEGDDQIRTAKRVVFQGFGNVDKAVVRTADEMNDMAFQSQPNAFSASQQFTQPLFLDAASQATDTVLFIRDSIPNGRWDLTMQRVDTSGDFFIRRRDAAGVSVDIPFRITALNGRASFTNLLIPQASIQSNDGSQAAPAYSFTNSFNTGMYSSASNVLNFSTGGLDRIALTGSEMSVKSAQLWVPAGTNSLPSYSFGTDQDTGMYLVTTNTFALVAGTNEQLRVKVNTLNMSNLPSSSAGLFAGDIFISGGFLAIV